MDPQNLAKENWQEGLQETCNKYEREPDSAYPFFFRLRQSRVRRNGEIVPLGEEDPEFVQKQFLRRERMVQQDEPRSTGILSAPGGYGQSSMVAYRSRFQNF